ncbi:MAG: ABC transporter ATP-binding protein [Bacteroidales bacterium]|jgi:lipoprotein-releasing system ATP-binding protein|nr:ABC transporter ATP-binding protein [Bacteroidales bacterium]MDD3330943.1 ABC transporter ATP-binding protein [Bacteroidales bacterium]MDD3692015.1 ABC transporter ATP-binding protein [Bacteroidales bacterium]MDD4044889.1 ABC transporter ATP-binding protein [Bacteroidales bacterium]MDD4581897.1 ABC transporter ATP-binding protein [Bacteroidales bacterium]
MIKVTQIKKSFHNLQVLKGIDLEIQKGEIVCLVGASGAGKSTLLHIIGTLDKPDSGEVCIKGENVFRLPDKELSQFRNRHIGFVFQFHHLLPEFTALENIYLPALIAKVPQKKAMEQAHELLDLFKLSNRADHKPSQLSGGEQQRIAVARALINKPSVVLADEPSGNLDSKNAKELHALFLELRDTLNQTFVIVTHNESFAAMADRTLHMADGVLIK